MSAAEKKSTANDAPAAKGGRRIFLAIGGAIVLCVLAAGVSTWMLFSTPINYDRQLTQGLQSLRKGIDEELIRRSRSIELTSIKTPAEIAKWELLRGAIVLEESEKSAVRQKAIPLAEEAHEHLKKSYEIGFPRGYDGLGNFLLGKVLYQLFRWPEATAHFEVAVAQWPAGRVESLEKLIDIELTIPDLDPKVIEDRLDCWDGLIGITPEERIAADVKRIEVLLSNSEVDKAIALATTIPSTSRQYDMSRYLMALSQFKRQGDLESIASEASFDAQASLEAILAQMKSVAQSKNVQESIQRRSRFYAGKVLQRLDRMVEAVSVLSVLRQSAPHTIEGLSGSIEEIYSLIKLHRHDDAMSTARQMHQQFGQLAWYENAWQPIPLLRDRMNEIGQLLISDRAYPQAIELSTKLPPFCDKTDQLRISSVSHWKWATALRGNPVAKSAVVDILSSSSEANQSQQEDQSKPWQRLFADSAKAYEELARLEMRSPEFADLIWRAIDGYQTSGELAHCNVVIESFLPFERRDQRPKAFLKLAENYFALHAPERSLQELRRCIDQHRDHPLAYQARLNAARIQAEQSDFVPAQAYLEENLYESSLNPNSPVWRESLFELGKIHYRQGESCFAEAEQLKENQLDTAKDQRVAKLEQANELFLSSIDRLGEWLKRYPDDPRRFETMYNIGKAFQMAAQYPEIFLNENRASSEDSRKQFTAQRRELLENAKKTFEQIRVGMNNLQSDDRSKKENDDPKASSEATSQPPNSLEESMVEARKRLLRNACFNEADLMFQLKQYAASLTAYRNIANRYLGEPEALEALMQAAECLKRMNRFEESSRVITQAREVLDLIPADQEPRFVSVTRFTRRQWSDLLTNLEKKVY